MQTVPRTTSTPPTTPVAIVLARLHGPTHRFGSCVAHTRPPLSAMTSPPWSSLPWIQRPEFCCAVVSRFRPCLETPAAHAYIRSVNWANWGLEPPPRPVRSRRGWSARAWMTSLFLTVAHDSTLPQPISRSSVRGKRPGIRICCRQRE